MSEWIKNTGSKPNVGERAYEVLLREGDWIIPSDSTHIDGVSDFDWSLEGVSGDIIEWRFIDTKLTQGEVQQLLHELRDTLGMVSEIKNEFKNEASRLWELSDKELCQSQGHFEDFSATRKLYLAYKKREERLVNLITKVKGLQ